MSVRSGGARVGWELREPEVEHAGMDLGGRSRRTVIVLLTLMTPVLNIVRIGTADANVCMADLIMPLASLWLVWRFLFQGARFPLASVWCASMAVIAVSLLVNVQLALAARGVAGLVVETSKMLLLWLYFYVAVNLVQSRRDLLLLVRTWLLGSSLVAIAGIYGSLSYHLWQMRTPYALGHRAHGTFGDANFFSMHLGVSLLLTPFYCQLVGRRPKWVIPLAALQLTAIVLSASRSGLLALVVGLMVPLVFWTRFRTKLALAASALVLAAFLSLLPSTMEWLKSNPFTARLATTTLDPAQTDRKELWANAFHAFLSSPMLGVGYGNAAHFDVSREGRMTEAHNTYLGLLAETGIVGLAVYLAAILYFPIALVRDARRISSQTASRACQALFAAFMVILVAGIPVNVENFRGLWMLMAIAFSYRLYWNVSAASGPAWAETSEKIWHTEEMGAVRAG